jgi:hypothetical protein
MQPEEFERIARAALRELGVGQMAVSIAADTQPDRWRISVNGRLPATFVVRAGRGTSAQHIREQIFEQFSGQ